MWFVLEHYPETKVFGFISGYGLVLADDSPYANRVFDPSTVDDFYVAPDAVRDEILRRHRMIVDGDALPIFEIGTNDSPQAWASACSPTSP
ncbi:SidA/IucD/PvdA family monooxygenase [Microbacterium sp. SA39]|uniref:SidA/IucD/PvdA family monooxygenase n=1 Tax=Microbacterium sp. SA39 TaxID=1263625 RepID=UPI00126A5292|nr:SidA/IucD/PvdA family monooxygenase [Microbacterium sp. SA39]